jgi:iron complex outermembrane receptor protein
MNESILRALILCAFFLGSIAIAAQKDQEPLDLTELSLEELMDIEVIYAASKHEQKLSEAPSSVTIVTGDEIKLFGYRTLAEVLGQVTGFYTTYDRNYRYVGVRGFSRPGDYNTRILVTIDGIRHNDNVYHSGILGSGFPLDIELIDRIEVVRGPGSSLYGASAFFAVVNIVTKDGSDLDGLQISGQGGSYGTYAGRLSYGDKFKNGLEILGSGTYSDSKGQDLYFQEFDDPATNNGIAEGGDYDQLNHYFFEVTYQAFTLRALHAEREKGIPTAPWGIYFNTDQNRTIDKWRSLNLEFNHAFQNQLGIHGHLYYDRYDFKGEYAWDWADPGDPPDVILNKDTVIGDRIGSELRLSKNLYQKHTVTVGAEFRYNIRQNQENFDIDPYWSYLDDEQSSTVWALFAQDQFQLTDELLFNVGLRYDHYETFNGTVNPRAALILSPLDKTNLKLLYGRAFRAPSSYELYYNDGDETQKANPDLEPERINTLELVLEQYIGDHLLGIVSVYDYQIEDLISFTEDEEGILFFDNLESVRAQGIELTLKGFLHNGIKAEAGSSFQVAEDGNGNILTNSPDYSAQFKISAPLLTDRLYTGFVGRYLSERRTPFNTYTDVYFVADWTVMVKGSIPGLEVAASVYNLFNESYGDPGSEEHLQDVIMQDGRSYRLKVSYHL